MSVLQVEPSIPTVLPKEKDTSEALQVKNFADMHETAYKFWEKAKEQYIYHKSQSLRQDMEDAMDTIDEYMRTTASHDKQDKDKTPDIEDLKPHLLMSAIDIITANEADIMFPRSEPIGKYAPMQFQDETTKPATKQLLQRQNALFEYGNEVDNRIPKFKNALRTINKYGRIPVEYGWTSREYAVNLPKRKKGMVGRALAAISEWLAPEVKIQKEEHPCLRLHDFKDFYCDMLLDDKDNPAGSLSNQYAIEIRCRVLHSDLVAGLNRGEYKNVRFVNNRQQYTGENPSSVLATRQTNAGENADTEHTTGQWEVWECWMRAPINDKGEWDEDNTAPRWFWATFCGQLESQSMSKEPPKDGESGIVCLRLSPNPYPYDELPFTVIHSHRDDKGMMHQNYFDMSKAVLEEYQTSLNQWFYNKDKMTAAPIFAEEGVFKTSDKTFDAGPTKIIFVQYGMLEKIKQFAVPSITNDMLAFIQFLERVFWEDIMHMPKGFRGQSYGSRTSASEAAGANQQSAKPFLDKVRYIGEQLVIWAARKDALYWRYFAPAEVVKAVTREQDLSEIAPSDMYGPVRYKITCVDDYEKNVIERSEMDRRAQVYLPLLIPTMTKEGIAELGRYAFRDTGLDTSSVFQAPKEGDAKANSAREVLAIMEGQWVQPSPDANDDIHIANEESVLAQLQTVPAEQVNPQTIPYLKAHIQMHQQNKTKQTMAASQAQQPQAATGLENVENPPANEGEMAQATMGAQGGGMM